MELQQEWSGMWLKLRFTIRCQHEIIEQLRIQESRIGLPSPCAIACVLRIAWNRDLLPHLEAHLNVFEDLSQIVPELVCGGRSVERRIIADGSKQGLPLVLILAVLSQTLTGKCALGLLLLVDLSLPTFISPGGDTEPDQR